MKTFTCVKTAVASLLLASAAVAWALPPQPLYGTSTSALGSGPIAITTTVPEQKNLFAADVAAYVVAAEENTSNQLEVIAWQDTHDAKTGFVQVGTQVEDRAALSSVAITGLDSSRVVTADIDPSSGTLSINTWVIGGTAGVVLQKGSSTPAYQNVAIATLSPTKVVTAYQLLSADAGADAGGASLAVEAWTIAADGSPTPDGGIVILPNLSNADEVSIATVSSTEVVTAANDYDDDTLWVATWGVDSAGVQSPQAVPIPNTVQHLGGETLGIGAGTALRVIHNPFFNLELVQSAFTPVIYGGQVAVLYWNISATGGLTQENTPVWTTTPGDANQEVAACIVAGKVPITIYGNNDALVNLEVYPYSSSIEPYSPVKNANEYGITSIASAAAGDDFNPIHLGTYDGYFVPAVLTYSPSDSPGFDVNNLKIEESSYPVDPTLL